MRCAAPERLHGRGSNAHAAPGAQPRGSKARVSLAARRTGVLGRQASACLRRLTARSGVARTRRASLLLLLLLGFARKLPLSSGVMIVRLGQRGLQVWNASLHFTPLCARQPK